MASYTPGLLEWSLEWRVDTIQALQSAYYYEHTVFDYARSVDIIRKERYFSEYSASAPQVERTDALGSAAVTEPTLLER